MSCSCCDNRRRSLLQHADGLNGLDFVAVSGKHELNAYFLKKLQHPLGPENLCIDGGARIRNLKVTGVANDPEGASNMLVVRLSDTGDFSNYTLRLVDPERPDRAPFGYDPAFAAAEFSFKFKTRSNLDPRRKLLPAAEKPAEPILDYLAKDYASFRRLLLNRLAAVSPDWRERHLPDVGIALVELLAYVGDYLSYQQDALATEAYLGTARRRVSVRRHARLIDYFMHDGCNARAWVQVQVMGDRGQGVKLPRKPTQFLTGVNGEAVHDEIVDPVIKHGSDAHDRALRQGAVVFEPLYDITLFPEHNRIEFHTWSNLRCCLPRGTTRATLKGRLPNLCPGDVLIFEETRDPTTGHSDDSDLTRCHAVRLTAVAPAVDPLASGVDLTEIQWAEPDALPFPFCLSARTDARHGENNVGNISVARGNIVLVDHGATPKDPEPLRDGPRDSVPEQTMFYAPEPSEDRCADPTEKPIAPRFRPELRRAPLTQAVPYDHKQNLPAAELLQCDPRQAVPQIHLQSSWQGRSGLWQPKRDLLNSGPNKMEFVVETESDGRTFLRFGDNQHGLRPASGTRFEARYRIGNGQTGNVGTEAIAYLVTDDDTVARAIADPKHRDREGGNAIRNPLPATGGCAPETIQEVRQAAPVVLAKKLQRAVTEEDYAQLLENEFAPHIQKAHATFRWTGSWQTVFLAIDRKGGLPLDDALRQRILHFLEPYRAAGYDLEIVEPCYVPLEVALTVRVKKNYFCAHVKQDLLEALSNRLLPDGQRGFFHPDEVTFGQSLCLSKLYARAQAVPGVAAVEVTSFQRRHHPDTSRPCPERLDFGRLEIARLDNNPNFPEFGLLTLEVKGDR